MSWAGDVSAVGVGEVAGAGVPSIVEGEDTGVGLASAGNSTRGVIGGWTLLISIWSGFVDAAANGVGDVTGPGSTGSVF